MSMHFQTVRFVGDEGKLKASAFPPGHFPRIGETVIQLGTKKWWIVKRVQYIFRENGIYSGEVLIVLAPRRRPTSKEYDN